MKTRRLDFKYTPLQVNKSITLVGGVPNEQTYDADTGEYSPDYSLTPLAIQPTVGVIDVDQVLESGCVNSLLTDVSWYKVEGGVESKTPLTTVTDKQVIITSGDSTGKILWYQNAQPQSPITLRFKAKFLDPRTNEVHNIIMDMPVTCRNATQYKPMLLLSSGDSYYNPLRDPDKQVIKAYLRLGSKECDTAKRQFVWELLRSTGYYTEVTSDDYEVTIASDGASVTLDRTLMGDKCSLRCRARYSASGNPAAVTLTDASPFKTVNIVRRIPSFDFDFLGVTDRIDPGTESVSPEAYIYDNQGKLPNPERDLLPLWYMGANISATGIQYLLKAHGMQPTIPTDLMDPNRGAILALDVKILAPLALASDADGKVFVDADGTPFVFH